MVAGCPAKTLTASMAASVLRPQEVHRAVQLVLNNHACRVDLIEQHGAPNRAPRVGGDCVALIGATRVLQPQAPLQVAAKPRDMCLRQLASQDAPVSHPCSKWPAQ